MAENKEKKQLEKKKVKTKGAYEYIKESLDNSLKERMIEWRRSNVVVKLEKPTDIGKARKLGYKDKKGFIITRIRIGRGGRKKTRPRKGRRSKRMTIRKVLKMNYRWVAEQRVQRKYPNLEVLNSYKLGKDGKNYFFEVILVDPGMPEIKNDSNVNWVLRATNRGRVFRGLTSAGKKSRGLRRKSRQLKIRPSSRARNRQGK